MKNIIKKNFLYFKGDSLLRKINRTPRIIFWHGVDENIDRYIEAETCDFESFKKQISYLNKNYEIISMDEFYTRFQNKTFTNNEIVLTFDDGYANNLYVVSPYLKKLSIPFTVFVSTEHIDKGELFPTSIARMILLGTELKYVSIPSLSINKKVISNKIHKEELYQIIITQLKSRPLEDVKAIVNDLISNLSSEEYEGLKKKYKATKPMSWEEVRKLHQSGAIIGSHCKYHICCHSNQSEQEVRKQIFESKKILEEKLQTDCNYFAYPNGNFTATSNIFVNEAGYLMGFSTEKNKRIIDTTDISIIPRIGVPLNINTFKIIINLYPKR